MSSGNKSNLVKHTEPSAESANATPRVTVAALEGSVFQILLLCYFLPSGKEALAGMYFRKDRYSI